MSTVKSFLKNFVHRERRNNGGSYKKLDCESIMVGVDSMYTESMMISCYIAVENDTFALLEKCDNFESFHDVLLGNNDEEHFEKFTKYYLSWLVVEGHHDLVKMVLGRYPHIASSNLNRIFVLAAHLGKFELIYHMHNLGIFLTEPQNTYLESYLISIYKHGRFGLLEKIVCDDKNHLFCSLFVSLAISELPNQDVIMNHIIPLEASLEDDENHTIMLEIAIHFDSVEIIKYLGTNYNLRNFSFNGRLERVPKVATLQCVVDEGINLFTTENVAILTDIYSPTPEYVALLRFLIENFDTKHIFGVYKKTFVETFIPTLDLDHDLYHTNMDDFKQVFEVFFENGITVADCGDIILPSAELISLYIDKFGIVPPSLKESLRYTRNVDKYDILRNRFGKSNLNIESHF